MVVVSGFHGVQLPFQPTFPNNITFWGKKEKKTPLVHFIPLNISHTNIPAHHESMTRTSTIQYNYCSQQIMVSYPWSYKIIPCYALLQST
jgi:hypothetical protein